MSMLRSAIDYYYIFFGFYQRSLTIYPVSGDIPSQKGGFTWFSRKNCECFFVRDHSFRPTRNLQPAKVSHY